MFTFDSKNRKTKQIEWVSWKFFFLVWHESASVRKLDKWIFNCSPPREEMTKFPSLERKKVLDFSLHSAMTLPSDRVRWKKNMFLRFAVCHSASCLKLFRDSSQPKWYKSGRSKVVKEKQKDDDLKSKALKLMERTFYFVRNLSRQTFRNV